MTIRKEDSLKDEPPLKNDEVVEFSACGFSNIEQASGQFSDESSKTVIRQTENSSSTSVNQNGGEIEDIIESQRERHLGSLVYDQEVNNGQSPATLDLSGLEMKEPIQLKIDFRDDVHEINQRMSEEYVTNLIGGI